MASTLNRNNEYAGICQVTRYARNLTYGLSQMDSKNNVGAAFQPP